MRVTCDNLEARARAEAAKLMLDRDEPAAVREAAARVSGIDQATPRGVEDMRAAVEQLKKSLAGRTDARAVSMLANADWLIRKSVWLIGGKALVLDSEVYSNTGGQASKATPMGAVAKFAAGGRPTMKKNLGGIILTYRDVYVAQISLGANPQAAAKALAEADAYDGPALVIAYSHCVLPALPLRPLAQREGLLRARARLQAAVEVVCGHGVRGKPLQAPPQAQSRTRRGDALEGRELLPQLLRPPRGPHHLQLVTVLKKRA